MILRTSWGRYDRHWRSLYYKLVFEELQCSAKLAHYKILDKIAAGGMGEVYRAEDTILHREVASKILPREMIGTPEREARVLASVPEVPIEGAYANVPGLSFDVDPDDEKLLLLQSDGGTGWPSHLSVILNFDQLVAEEMQ